MFQISSFPVYWLRLIKMRGGSHWAPVPVQCPHCQNTEVIKAGKQANGTQRYQCQNGPCERRIFLLHYQQPSPGA